MTQKQTDSLKLILYTSPRTDQILAESSQINERPCVLRSFMSLISIY